MKTCDLWEEIQSESLFWNLYTTRKAIYLGLKLAKKLNDTTRIEKYLNSISEIEKELINHVTNEFIFEDSNRQIDSSVINALNIAFRETLDDPFISVTDTNVAKTV